MVATQEPKKLVVGDTWSWSRTDLGTDYPPGDGWVLKYVFLNAAGKIEIDAVEDNGNYLVNVAALTTAAYSSGRYRWEAAVVKGTDRYRVDEGELEVLPDFASLTLLDTRSHARKVLEAIEAVIERRATKDQSSYSIDNRRLDRTPIGDLLLLRDRYKMEAERDAQAEELRKGGGTGRIVLTRFR